MTCNDLCPNLLFGSSVEVKLEIKKILKKAWKIGYIPNFDATQCTEFNQIPAFWISDDSKFPLRKQECWRFYLIGQTMRGLLDGRCPLMSITRYDMLMLDGLNKLWFTLGQLYSGFGRFSLPTWKRANDYKLIALKYLQAMLPHYIPIMLVSDKLRGPAHPNKSKNKNYIAWHMTYSELLYDLGWPEKELIACKSSQNLLNYMIDNSIAEYSGESIVIKNSDK